MVVLTFTQPYGAMCLNRRLLDADALSEALIMILKESKSDNLLTLCSDERRKVIQSFVDPTTTANKLRLHSPCLREAVNDDHYFQEMQNPTPEVIQKNAKHYFDLWCTDIRSMADTEGL